MVFVEREGRGCAIDAVAELKFDPTPTLLSSGNKAVEYSRRRDLLGQQVEAIGTVWQLPEVKKILRHQQPDGAWRLREEGW